MPSAGGVASAPEPNPQLLNAIVRAHAWVKLLQEGIHDSLESLADAVKLHPNFVRHAIRSAFIDPSITEAVLRGSADAALLSKLRLDFGIAWTNQQSKFKLSSVAL